MQKLYYFLLALLIFISCRLAKTTQTAEKKTHTKLVEHKRIKNLIAYAKTFEGVNYKYGGTTRKGMDCSGLVFTTFKKENIQLPRSSKDIAKYGKTINLKQVIKGDLLFFITSKKKTIINHVGLVIKAPPNEPIQFIHSTTSRGVIISSLSEKYWKTNFVKATRIID